MQGPTHLVAGILIQKFLKKVRPPWRQYSAVAALAVISHSLLDRLARATFHPPAPLFNDWFWVISHLTFGVLTVCILVWGRRDYKFSMACSVLPDLDWVFRAGLSLFSSGFQKPPLHTLVIKFFDFFIPAKIWEILPNWNLARKGLIVEAVLFALLLVCLQIFRKRRAGVER